MWIRVCIVHKFSRWQNTQPFIYSFCTCTSCHTVFFFRLRTLVFYNRLYKIILQLNGSYSPCSAGQKHFNCHALLFQSHFPRLLIPGEFRVAIIKFYAKLTVPLCKVNAVEWGFGIIWIVILMVVCNGSYDYFPLIFVHSSSMVLLYFLLKCQYPFEILSEVCAHCPTPSPLPCKVNILPLKTLGKLMVQINSLWNKTEINTIFCSDGTGD